MTNENKNRQKRSLDTYSPPLMLPCGNQLLGHKHHDIFYSGEDVYISLHGSCEELNIHLEPDSIWMENTYVSLISTRTVSLTNHSGIPLQYCWTVWPSQQEEDLSLLRYLCMSTKCIY